MTLLLSKVTFWGPGARTSSYLWGDKIQSVTITRSFSFPKLLWVKEVYSLWQGASCPPTVVLPSVMRCDCQRQLPSPALCFPAALASDSTMPLAVTNEMWIKLNLSVRMGRERLLPFLFSLPEASGNGRSPWRKTACTVTRNIQIGLL